MAHERRQTRTGNLLGYEQVAFGVGLEVYTKNHYGKRGLFVRRVQGPAGIVLRGELPASVTEIEDEAAVVDRVAKFLTTDWLTRVAAGAELVEAARG